MLKQLKIRIIRLLKTNEITDEDEKIDKLRQEYEANMMGLKEEMNDKFFQILSMIQNNPLLAHVKPDVLSPRQHSS